MFPFQRSGELSFQPNEFIGEEEQNNIENQFCWNDATSVEVVQSMNTTNVNLGQNNRGRGRGRGRGRDRGRKSVFSPGNTSNNCNENKDDLEKKTIHREVERQRRLEMSNLYSSLRSTLPPEYIKGKRSTSDHLAEAVNYIKDLEKNIQDLSIKRDELKSATPEWTTASPTPTTYLVGGSSHPRPRRGTVVMNPCVGGLDIEIDVGCEDERFALSSALQVVFEEGLGVSSCISTKVDERVVHKMVCEVNDITCLDINRLQHRLLDLVC